MLGETERLTDGETDGLALADGLGLSDRLTDGETLGDGPNRPSVTIAGSTNERSASCHHSHMLTGNSCAPGRFVGAGLGDGLGEIERLTDGETDALTLALGDGLTLEDGDGDGDDRLTLMVGVTEYVTLVVAPLSNTRNVSVSPSERSVSISSTV